MTADVPAIVIVSVAESPVIVMPVPAVSVSVSVAESATGLVPDGQAIVRKESDATPVAATVMVSVAESPVIVMPAPAVSVSVSVAESATGLVPDGQVMVRKESDATPVAAIVIASVAESPVIVMPEPAVNVSVSVDESATGLVPDGQEIVLNESEAAAPEPTSVHAVAPSLFTYSLLFVVSQHGVPSLAVCTGVPANVCTLISPLMPLQRTLPDAISVSDTLMSPA